MIGRLRAFVSSYRGLRKRHRYYEEAGFPKARVDATRYSRRDAFRMSLIWLRR